MQVKQGQVIVRAPTFVKEAFINAFIQEKSVWLKNRIVAQQQAQEKCFDFGHGSEVFLLGDKVNLVIRTGKKGQVFTEPAIDELTELNKHDNQKDSLVVVINERNKERLIETKTLPKQVKKQLESYFKVEAQNYISTRLVSLSAQTSLVPKQIKIKQYRARWGSCNNRQEVSFNYLLMMAPPSVIDYVIVHELCHLIHLNHSTDFWQLVGKHCPYYQEAKQWLSSHQNDLVWQLPC